MTQKFCTSCGNQVNFTSQFCNACGTDLLNSLTGKLQANTMLDGRYLIHAMVGQGGMGAVYKAVDTRIKGRVCAVKEMSVLQLPPSERAMSIQNFEREAQLLAELHHTALPKVHDYFQEGHSGRYYLVMDFVEGDSLENLLVQRGSPFPEAQVRQWAAQLCDVLTYLHDQSPPIIFRDLNPRNVMVDPSTGKLKLIDFGIARFFKTGNSADTQAFGSPGYAPPEQYGQAQTDARSDVYSLGVAILNLTTRHDPSTDPFNLPLARRVSPLVSQELETIIYRATQTQPDLRYQTTADMQCVLLGKGGAIGAGGGKTAVLWKPIAGVVGALAILFLIGMYFRPVPTEPTPISASVIAPEVVTVIVTEEAVSTTEPTLAPATEAVETGILITPEVKKTATTAMPTILPTETAVPTAPPTATTIPSVSIDLPTLNEAENMSTVWQGVDFEDLQSPATKRYSTVISSGEKRRWSFIWCGKTPADLQNILAPLTFSLLVDGQPIPSEKLLEHDKVINNWHCRYWSTILYNWSSRQTVELEAHYQLSERIYDGEGYYGAGTYRQIISVQVP